jgi:hypothetical protein
MVPLGWNIFEIVVTPVWHDVGPENYDGSWRNAQHNVLYVRFLEGIDLFNIEDVDKLDKDQHT